MFRRRETKIQLTDPDIFRQFYEHTHLALYRYIYGLHGGPREDVEDLTAEAYLRAWNARRRFEGSAGAAKSWIYRIARNLVIDNSRREKSRGLPEPINLSSLAAEGDQPEPAALRSDLQARLWQRLQALSVQQREILVLRYLAGWRVKAIAEHLEMNENTVSVNIRRGLSKLKASWSRSEETHG
jgi:RNA polymerase sigma-70 factor (ECF subfamily)